MAKYVAALAPFVQCSLDFEIVSVSRVRREKLCSFIILELLTNSIMFARRI